MPKKSTPLRSQPCTDCEKPFDVYHRYQIRCVPCQISYRSKRKKEYNLVCQSCQEAFRATSYRTKKCIKCASISICKTCTTQFEKVNYQHRDYCSEKCSYLAKRELYFGGNYYAVLTRDNHSCRKCGSKEESHVHHIDLSGRFRKTDKERCNNNMTNLVTMCNSCHQELHNHLQFELVNRYLDDTISITNKFLGVS